MKLVLLTQKPLAPTVRRLAALLSTKLGYKVLRTKQVDLAKPWRRHFEYLNKPGYCKITQLHNFTEHGVSCPPWTTDRNMADEWDGTVCVRHLTNSSQGKGLEIVSDGPVPQAPLYTLYIRRNGNSEHRCITGRC